TGGSLQRVLCSGEALTADLVHRFFESFGPGVELHNLYGPTEAAVDVTAWPCSPDDADGVVPIGRPVANTHLHVMDERCRPVPVGTVGELYIGGVQVATGYLHQPELTAERFVTDPDRGRLYRTGDLARWSVEGALLYHGRNDDQLKIRGNRVEPGEIEAVLQLHPSVEAAAVALHDDGRRQQLVAHVRTGGADIDESELRAFLETRLPGYMVPNRFVTQDHFALTASGKIDRRALPTPAWSEADTDETAHRPPETPVEKQLAVIWRELLGRDQVGTADDFFALGGHSLDAVRVNGRIHQDFGVVLPLAVLFEHPTIGGLAPVITAAMVEDQLDDDEIQRLLEDLSDEGETP
ncbi:MAG: AMP-binding protein, partial [Actinomycetota bacterium]